MKMESNLQSFVSYTAAPTALDADGIAAAQQLAEAGNLLINGVLATGGIATFGEQQRVTLYSAGNLSALTFTVYGATTFGDSISEDIAGPNNGTVTTTANFKTVSRVAVSGVVGTNVIVGNSNALETPWIALNRDCPVKGISVVLSSGASLTYEVQYGTYPRLSNAETSVLAKADSTLTAKSASDSLAITIPWPMARLKITSFVSGTSTLRILESPA